MNQEVEALIRDLDDQRALLMSVATGGPQIRDKEHEYAARRYRIQQKLSGLGIADPIPFADLWAWYGKWSSGDLPRYQDRRTFITNLFSPLRETLQNYGNTSRHVVPEPTGWTRVDRGLDKVREALDRAKNEEDFQGVGLLCRETLISAAQEVYVPFLHRLASEPLPSSTDFFGMFELYITHELSGAANEVLRNYAKSTNKLANQLVHHRTATLREAMLAAEATRATVNFIAIIAGKRSP